MANPHKGEVEFEADGRTRVLRLDTNAMCELEAEFDMGIMRVLAHLELGRMTDIRRIFRAALDGKPDLDEVTAIIDELGGYLPATDLLEKTVRAAFPQAEAAQRQPPSSDSGSDDFEWGQLLVEISDSCRPQRSSFWAALSDK